MNEMKERKSRQKKHAVFLRAKYSHTVPKRKKPSEGRA